MTLVKVFLEQTFSLYMEDDDNIEDVLDNYLKGMSNDEIDFSNVIKYEVIKGVKKPKELLK